MERPPKKYVCEKCGYLGDTSEHEGCDYLAWTTGEQLYIDQLEDELATLRASPASVPEGTNMDKQYLSTEFDSFFEFPSDDKSQVSSISAKLFAEHIAYPIKAEVERLRDEIAALRQNNRELLDQRFDLMNKPTPPVSEDRWLPTMEEKMQEQLATLAEQNEKMRKVLLRLACLGNGDQYGNSIGNCIAQEALSLPNLASPVLNRIKAEAYREAAEICEAQQTWITNGAAGMLLRAKADELENSNG